MVLFPELTLIGQMIRSASGDTASAVIETIESAIVPQFFVPDGQKVLSGESTIAAWF